MFQRSDYKRIRLDNSDSSGSKMKESDRAYTSLEPLLSDEESQDSQVSSVGALSVPDKPCKDSSGSEIGESGRADASIPSHDESKNSSASALSVPDEPYCNTHSTRNTVLRKSNIAQSMDEESREESDEDSTSSVLDTSSNDFEGNKAHSKGAVAFDNSQSKSSLYFKILNCRGSPTKIVNAWIEQYNLNKQKALLMLMQFFISASGCTGLITPEMQTQEHSHLIEKIAREFDTGSEKYPLVRSGQQWKKFCSKFCKFVQILVHQCQDSILYDQFLMDNVISLLSGLSDSQVRSFRHTATLAALKIMTALVDVALTVETQLNDTQRQYDAEHQLNRDEKDTDRLKSLLAKKNKLEEKMNEINAMLAYMFSSVFVHRYRDILPDIRSICMTEIGIWMEKWDSRFVHDSYLKYIGWTLHDKEGEVRLKCLSSLQALYASEKFRTELHLFTNTFKNRIIAMTLDKRNNVAVQAVKLLTSIGKHHKEILSLEDRGQIYGLVYSSHSGVAEAVGEFVNQMIFAPREEIGVITRSGKKRLPNTPLIQDLIDFFIESEHHKYGAYLVDSLINLNPMMKDWECMTDLLLEEPGETEEPLNDKEEFFLIEIMVCCIKQSATGETPVGRGPSRKKLSAREIEQVQEDKQHLTEHFIRVLPHLLEKYSADPESLPNLLSIPRYFELDIYMKSKQEQNLDFLLTKIHDIVGRSSDAEVLCAAAITLEDMCVPESLIFERCDNARLHLIDSISHGYKEIMEQYRCALERNDHVSKRDLSRVMDSLKKVAIFYKYHQMCHCDIGESLFKNMKDFANKLPEEAIKDCIHACFFHIVWSQNHLIQSTDATNTAEEKCSKLKGQLHDFIDHMSYLISTKDDIPLLLREEAFSTISDLLLMFNDQLILQENPLLQQLIYKSDKNMQLGFNEFIQQHVFCTSEEDEQDEHSKTEELNKRRKLLAAYCKLVIYNIIPSKVAADVFKYQDRFHSDYGDIFDATICKAQDINSQRLS